MSSTTTIPSFYRIFFPTIDPLIALTGIIANLFAPEMILKSYSPSAVSPPPIEAIVNLNTIAAYLAGTILLQTVLLRARPTDLVVWRLLQASILIVDLGMLAAIGQALSKQGRMGVSDWNVEEVGNIVVTGGVAVIRVAFLLGVGMGGQRKGKWKPT